MRCASAPGCCSTGPTTPTSRCGCSATPPATPSASSWPRMPTDAGGTAPCGWLLLGGQPRLGPAELLGLVGAVAQPPARDLADADPPHLRDLRGASRHAHQRQVQEVAHVVEHGGAGELALVDDA